MRCSLVVVVLALALCAPASASAQAPPADLWESAPAAGGSPGSSGRDAALFVLALVAFAGAGGVGVLALRTPRRAPAPRPARIVAEPRPPRRAERVTDLAAAAPEPEPQPAAPVWHPRVAGPPPLPAFGPGSHSGPTAAPPPPPD